MKVVEKLDRIRQLTKLIRECGVDLDTGGPGDVGGWLEKFTNLGIIANMHVGRGEEMGRDTLDGVMLQLEWYAGGFVGIGESMSYFAMNSWLNCVDKFAPALDY